MEHKEWTTMDKESWGPGPWMCEPDKIQFADEATGLPCLIKRAPVTGALCGYVGVPAGHPWHGKGYSALEETVEAHGGLTYADSCQEGPEAETICHVPGPGEPEPLWWVGFDCAHAFDICPKMAADLRSLGHDRIFDGSFGEAYKTVAYVKAECAALAAQATGAAASVSP